MTPLVLVLAALSVGAAGVAVTVAILSWSHTPGQIVPNWRRR